MGKTVLFLTHRAAERELALAIKKAVEAAFPGVDVFMTSDPENVGAGDPWVDYLSSKLATCEVQIILASPAALERPWVHFEAGAGWRKAKQIPLCHSGQDPGKLPIPLSLLQAGRVADPEYLKSVFDTIARIAENRPPTVDYAALARELGEIEAEYMRAAPEAPTDGVAVIPRTIGPEMRDLSESRQRLETQLYAAILRWNTLRRKGLTGNPQLTVRAVEVVNAFWADPKSLVLDHEVANALAAVEASIADLQGRAEGGKPVRTQLLLALRELAYKQDGTNEILRFDVTGLAADAGVSHEHVARRLRDLLTEGLAERNYPTMGEGEMQGALKITARGLAELRRLGETEE